MDIDVNKPVENPKLKDLLNRRANNAGREQMELLNQIGEEIALNAAFLAVIDISGPGTQQNGDGTAVFAKDTKISFPGITFSEGSHAMPLFTDWEELRKWPAFSAGKVNTLILPFDDVFSIVSGNKGAAVINPFGDAFFLPFSAIEGIKRGKESRGAAVQKMKVEKDTKVTLGEPKEYPKRMTDAVCTYAKKIKEIKTIWLKLMIKEGEKSYLLVVDADGDPRSYFQGIADAAVPFLPKGMYIDMIPFSDSFGRSAATGTPFYKRRRGLFG